jgi:hypothetical protein
LVEDEKVADDVVQVLAELVQLDVIKKNLL